MTKQIISSFKTAIDTTELIKQYAQDGYGSVLITIVAGEVVEVKADKKFRFEKDYSPINGAQKGKFEDGRL